MILKHVNAVIIGSGAGGGAVAKELAEAGLSVVVLERGKWMKNCEHFDDEFLFVNPDLIGPDEKHVRVASNNGRNWETVPASSVCNNATCVGGGTQFYAAMAWRFFPEDFKMRSTYGEVAGANLEDWPITYEELAPFYEKVEWEVGVSGDNRENPLGPPMAKNYPMPAFPYNDAGKLLAATGRRMGLHPFPVSMLRNSIPWGGKPACAQRSKCMGWNCPWNARNGSQNTTLVDAMATDNCEIRVKCMANEIFIDDTGRAKGVKYFDENDKAQYQTADIVIASGGATESARLLLNSKSKLFPNGAGNNYDLVGRNLQGHLYSQVSGIYDERIDGGPGPGRSCGFMDFQHHNPGIVGGGLMDGSTPQYPFAFARSVEGWGKSYKDQLRNTFGKRISIAICTQEMPVYESRVFIDPNVKDFWGIPVLRVSAMRHPNDYKVVNFLANKGADLLREAGAKNVNRPVLDIPNKNFFNNKPHGQHQCGTCRMGNDKKLSVTNKYGQVHEIDNLFVADAGLHVTNSGFNPGETIMALGFWVGNYIKNGWNGTKFRS